MLLVCLVDGHPNPHSPGKTVQDKNSQTATLTTELVCDSIELNLICVALFRIDMVTKKLSRNLDIDLDHARGDSGEEKLLEDTKGNPLSSG